MQHDARVCVPRSLRATLLQEFHDTPICGHVGIDKTHALISREYYWKNMYKDITVYVNSCASCQYAKTSTQASSGLVRPLPIPLQPGQVYGIDYIIGLPPDKHGNNCCVTIIDFCCNRVYLAAAVSSTDPRDADNPLTAEQTARIFYAHVFRHKGLPLGIVSDSDTSLHQRFLDKIAYNQLH
jgi:hypothetical protein